MLDWLKIDRLDLGPKLILAFVLVALLVGVSGAVGYHAVSTVDEEAHLVGQDGAKMDDAAVVGDGGRQLPPDGGE